MPFDFQFTPGLILNEAFSREVVEPLIAKGFSGLRFSTGLVGYGSDALGFDTSISMDHNWGPRPQVFVPDGSSEQLKSEINVYLQQNLPATYKGFPVNFSVPDGTGIKRMKKHDAGPVLHAIDIFDSFDFLERCLGIRAIPQDQIEWLAFPQQALLELVGGKIFRTELREIVDLRKAFEIFPRDIFLYRLAVEWSQIAEEEAFVGRCGDFGDEIGFRSAASRITTRLMRIGFLLEGKYAPYSKWFGTAFQNLPMATKVQPDMVQTLRARDWKEAETHLLHVYSFILQKHEDHGLLSKERYAPDDYYGRPYKVVFAGEIASDLIEKVNDERLRKIRRIGTIDQAFENIDVTNFRRLQRSYTQLVTSI